jgi:hypothetical protein
VGQFGDKFRKAREKKGISLDDASNVTKIGSRMLQAIEEEHFDQLPGGVFNKGFIRAYAKHLGINDQEAVSEYLECLRQEQVKAQAVWQPQTRPAAPEKRPPAGEKRSAVPANPGSVKAPVAVQHKPLPGEELPDLQLPKAEHVRRPRQKYLDRHENPIPWRLIAATVVVFVLALVLWRRHAIGNAASPAMATQPAAIASSTTAPATSVAPAAQPSGNSNATPVSGNPSAQAASGAVPAAVKAATGAPDNKENDVTVQPVGGATSAPAEKPAAPLMLVIRATENSWISVSADGQNVSSENLIAPAHTSVRASREIVARVGNAAGVTFLWNGKEIPAQGAEAEVKTFVFDAQGMRVLSTNQPATQTP